MSHFTYKNYIYFTYIIIIEIIIDFINFYILW